MSPKSNNTDWHDLLQTILEEHMPLMSGKTIIHRGREKPKTIKLDYYCQARKKPGPPPQGAVIFPFGHFKTHNVVEYKRVWEYLDERMFRYYVGRTLLVENDPQPGKRQGKTTLTILVSHKPRNLLNKEVYKIHQLSTWNYRSDWIEALEIHILDLSGMRGIVGGEPLAFLQILEGNPHYRKMSWEVVLRQELTRPELLKRIIMKIDKEAFMSVADDLIQKGETKGETRGKASALLNMLRSFAPDLLAKYQAAIESAKNLSELNRLEAQIMRHAPYS